MDLSPLLKVAGTLFLTYSTHYGAIKLYSTFCIPDNLLGYLQGMITTGSPVCSATLAYASNSQTSYATIITMTISRAIMDAVLPSSSPA
jgi:hypothetical protein